MAKILYPRPRHIIRTSSAVAVIILGEFILAALLLAVVAVNGRRPLPAVGLVFASLLMSVGFGKRALTQLQQLEQTRDQPDALMVSLFDLALGVPTAGLVAVAAFASPV